MGAGHEDVLRKDAGLQMQTNIKTSAESLSSPGGIGPTGDYYPAAAVLTSDHDFYPASFLSFSTVRLQSIFLCFPFLIFPSGACVMVTLQLLYGLHLYSCCCGPACMQSSSIFAASLTPSVASSQLFPHLKSSAALT